MAFPRIAAETEAKIAACKAEGLSRSATARALGIDRSTVGRYWVDDGTGPAPADDGPAHKVEEKGDARTETFASRVKVRTAEDAARFAEADPAVWRVKHWSCTAWQVALKLRDFDGNGRVVGETPHTEDLWRVSVTFERLAARPDWLQAAEAVCRRMEGHAPDYSGVRKARVPRNPHLLEVDAFDVHFGKLAWAPETGQNYDLKIAESVYRNAIEDLLDLSAGFAVERIVLPIGNDFLHIDSEKNTTTSGTVVDTDGRYAKIVEAGTMAVIWAVEALAARAEVDVLWVPGNHDRKTSYHLCRELAAWFRTHPNVRVDVSPRLRKRYVYGRTMVGFTHGCYEKQAGLPLNFANEFAEDWGATRHREVHCGHFHKAKRHDFIALDTFGGIPVRTLMSLSAVDSWHYQQGYVGTRRAAEAYIVHPEDGIIGHFAANVRE